MCIYPQITLFFGTKIQFSVLSRKKERPEIMKETTYEENVSKGPKKKYIKNITYGLSMRENCKQKRTRPTPIRRILECRPLFGLKGSGLNSASFLLRRTPSQHSRGIASKVSVYLFVSPSSYSSKLFLTSLVSLSLSLPNVLESCHWIAFHRFHASSLGALIGHLSIQLQLKLSFRVHR